MNSRFNLLLVLPFLIPSAVAAQDADLEAQAAQAHEQYAEFWTAGDVDGLLGLFTDDAKFWPVSGGQYSGTSEIRQALEEDPAPVEATIEGVHLERLNGVIVDIGTFAATMPDEMDGAEMRGEYVALLVENAEGIRIQHLISFPVRQTPPLGE